MTDLPSRTDVVIIGSGPTGATFARVIADAVPRARVLVLEVGPVVSEPPGGHVRNISDPSRREKAQVDSQGRRRAPYPTPSVRERAAAALPGGDTALLSRPGTFLLGSRSRQPGEDGLPALAMSANVGGMGVHWTCACPRPGAGEWIEDIPRDELEEAFETAEDLLHVTTHAFRGAPFGDLVRERLATLFDDGRDPGRRVQPMPLAVTVTETGTRRWSGPDVILADLLTPARTSGSAAESVEEAAPGVSLVAGVLCRRILHDGSTASGVEVEVVGTGQRFVVDADHVVVAGDAIRTPQLLFASGLRPNALGRYLNDQHQIMSAVRLAGVEVPGVSIASGRPGTDPMSGVSWVPFDRDTHPFHGQVMQLDASPIELPEGDSVLPGSIVGLGWFTAKDLHEDDCVTFSETEVDDFGMPAPEIHYRLSRTDHEMIGRAVQIVEKAAAALGSVLDDEPPTLLPLGSSLHYQGTVRLGAREDGRSVCDPRSRVWGTTNVYVAGNGVIPTSTACNPTLTSVALAVIGARAIAGDLLTGGDVT